jgi:hypothetical protein
MSGAGLLPALEDEELAELKALHEKKELYGWTEDSKEFITRRALIEKKYLHKAKQEVKDAKPVKVEVDDGDGEKPDRAVYNWGKRAKVREQLLDTHDWEEGKALLNKWRPGEWKNHPKSRGNGQQRVLTMTTKEGKQWFANLQKKQGGKLWVREGELRADAVGDMLDEDVLDEDDEDNDDDEPEPPVLPQVVPPAAEEESGRPQRKKKAADANGAEVPAAGARSKRKKAAK